MNSLLADRGSRLPAYRLARFENYYEVTGLKTFFFKSSTVRVIFASVGEQQCFGSAFDWLPGSGSVFGMRIRIQEV
jgi:hypothetical protein